MKRRDAIKGMGLSAGYALGAPTFLSLLQSCTTEPAEWLPQYLNQEEAMLIKQLIDLILPQTDRSPGALEVNVPEFVDLYYGKVLNQEKQLKFSRGLGVIIDELQISPESKPLWKVDKKEFETILSKYLRITKAEREAFYSSDNLAFSTLLELRQISVRAFLTSARVGREVLAYDPIPGEQIGCLSVEEATGGKKWSL